MKQLFLISLLTVFAGITYFLEQQERALPEGNNSSINEQPYESGILRSEYQNVKAVANYIISAELIPAQKLVRVEEELTWINKTESPAKEILLHLYPNALRNNKTLFIKGRGINLTEESKSGIYFQEILAEEKPALLSIIHPEIPNKFDSTVAKITLDKTLNPGDSVKLYFKYTLPIPKMMKRFGYAGGRNFFFISQWFPKAGVFSNGQWNCSQYHPYTNYFSDFGKYSVRIIVPRQYLVAATGVLKDSSVIEEKVVYKFEQYGVHDFAWMATDNINENTSVYRREDGSEILIKAFIQPEHAKYKERFIKALRNSLNFFEKYVGSYPYQTLTIIDVPKTSMSGGMEYPTLISVGAELFSPEETLQPEYVTIHEFVHQFFYGIVANNEVTEAWLDEGLTSYIATKIAYKYYGEPFVNFKLFGYYPVLGMNFISYNEIPLVYTLGHYKASEGSAALTRYYQSPQCASISDTSYKLPDPVSYVITGYNKPELMLLSLERYLGFEKVMRIFKAYYDSYKFDHPTGNDFLKSAQDNSEENISWFFNSQYKDATAYDYSIKYVKATSNPDEYEVFAERLRDGVFKVDVAFYTEKDTLYQKWNGEERWKKMIFHSRNKVIGAEIDPLRKNIMDLNYSNNSYLIKEQFAGSISIVLRWLFWIQNLILLLGSAA